MNERVCHIIGKMNKCIIGNLWKEKNNNTDFSIRQEMTPVGFKSRFLQAVSTTLLQASLSSVSTFQSDPASVIRNKSST